MASKKRLGFPYKTFLFLAFLGVSGYVYFDSKQAGSWQASKTRQFLHDLGVCEYTHKALDKVKLTAFNFNVYLQENYPEYHSKVVTFSEPYVDLGRDLGLVVYNAFGNAKELVVAKYPLVIQQIELYAPGLLEQSQKAIGSAWNTSLFYFNRSVDYMKTEVFVGKLSPENMQKIFVTAFNTTQQKAAEYYEWLYAKVQTAVN